MAVLNNYNQLVEDIANLEKIVKNASKVPLTAYCMLDKEDVLNILNNASKNIPLIFRESQKIIKEQNTLKENAIKEGEEERERLNKNAKENDSRATQSSQDAEKILQQANEDAKKVIAAAQEEANNIRAGFANMQLENQRNQEICQRELVEFRNVQISNVKQEADNIIGDAQAEAKRLLSEHELVVRAQLKADEITNQAQIDAQRLFNQVKEYMENMFTQVDVALSGNLQSIRVIHQEVIQALVDE